MNRMEEQCDDVVDLGVASVETQGGGGIQLDTDHNPNLGVGIAND